jgi:trehalose 6-phosphate phosphatase
MKRTHPMQSILSPDGDAALQRLLQTRPLLGFDFDGTLSPIVDHPDDARIAPGVAQRLQALASRLPVAVVTGRSVADVRPRLGFEPLYLVGNHGAEDDGVPPEAGLGSPALQRLRQDLNAAGPALAAAGVWLEDKGPSIALHYRLAPDAPQALDLIDRLLQPTANALRVFGGKMVVNAMSAQAPDKAQAMHRLVARCGAATAFFAGDDINDEAVFAAAAPDWVTVRVGVGDGLSQARFCLVDTDAVIHLLDRMLALMAPHRAG